MVEELFRQDAYLKEADAIVTAQDERGVRLDRTIFYPTGGGQPGDTGLMRWDGGEAKIVDALKALDSLKTGGGDVLHVLAPDAPKPLSAQRYTSRSTGSAATGTCACILRCMSCRRSSKAASPAARSEPTRAASTSTSTAKCRPRSGSPRRST